MMPGGAHEPHRQRQTGACFPLQFFDAFRHQKVRDLMFRSLTLFRHQRHSHPRHVLFRSSAPARDPFYRLAAAVARFEIAGRVHAGGFEPEFFVDDAGPFENLSDLQPRQCPKTSESARCGARSVGFLCILGANELAERFAALFHRTLKSGQHIFFALEQLGQCREKRSAVRVAFRVHPLQHVRQGFCPVLRAHNQAICPEVSDLPVLLSVRCIAGQSGELFEQGQTQHLAEAPQFSRGQIAYGLKFPQRIAHAFFGDFVLVVPQQSVSQQMHLRIVRTGPGLWQDAFVRPAYLFHVVLDQIAIFKNPTGCRARRLAKGRTRNQVRCCVLKRCLKLSQTAADQQDV